MNSNVFLMGLEDTGVKWLTIQEHTRLIDISLHPYSSGGLRPALGGGLIGIIFIILIVQLKIFPDSPKVMKRSDRGSRV